MKLKIKDSAGKFDRALGRRLRLIRKMRGLSQESLGNKTDVTSQQTQKYETGANKVSTAKLVKFAEVLKVPVTDFLGDVTPLFPRPDKFDAESIKL